MEERILSMTGLSELCQSLEKAYRMLAGELRSVEKEEAMGMLENLIGNLSFEVENKRLSESSKLLVMQARGYLRPERDVKQIINSPENIELNENEKPLYESLDSLWYTSQINSELTDLKEGLSQAHSKEKISKAATYLKKAARKMRDTVIKIERLLV